MKYFEKHRNIMMEDAVYPNGIHLIYRGWEIRYKA
jgi:hypothetical protein